MFLISLTDAGELKKLNNRQKQIRALLKEIVEKIPIARFNVSSAINYSAIQHN